MAGGGIKINNIKVSGGADGATFIPSVDSSGTLSWTNNKGYENPAPVNLKGADGKDGINGKDGATGAKIVSTVFYGRDEDDNSIYLQTFDDGSTAFFTASKGRDGNRILYFRDEAKPYFEEEDEESLRLPLKRFLGTPKANDFVISADGYLFDVERIVEETAVCEYLTEIKGERGSLWYSGDTPPIEGIKENDHFLDTNTLDIYIYDGEKWGKIGSLAIGGTAETGDFVSKDGDIITGALLFNSSRTMQQALVSPNGFEVGVGVDGESVAVDKTEYGNGGITKTEGDTIKDFALPEKSGTLATEDKARSIAIEEIAKYDFIKIVEELPDEGLPNRIYLVPHEAEEGSNDLFDMWLWVNDAWEFEGTKSAEIDNTLYVKFTDYATAKKAGVVFVKGSDTGLSMRTSDGTIQVEYASKNDISHKNRYRQPITPIHLDYAVKVGITTNTETLTDEEKQAVASWIGTQAQNKPNMLVQRYGSGNIAVPLVPADDVHATSKKYVDDGFVPKPTSTIYGSYIIPYVVSTAGQQGDIGDIIKIEIGNGANTIARRGINGTLEVGTPISALHAANKQYVDDGFVAKPASFTGGARVLSISASGETGTLKYSSAPSSDCIPVANSKGNIKTNTPEADLDCANKKYVVDNKGTKLYKHTISGFVGGTGIIDIFSITLIATSNTKITCASDLDLQYTQYGISANTAYGKVVNIVQTMTDEITMQFHSRPAGGEVETVVLDASSITDNVEAL